MYRPIASSLLLLATASVGVADEPALVEARTHWSYRAPVRPTVPAVNDASWVRNPVDAFIAAGHERLGLAPAAEASRATLLRRVSIDLTGLPPSRRELRAFLEDPRDDAYERLVDRLLASPRHGERWGRHWMDVWRYSDWYGRRGQNEIRYGQYHIWRWRDWIIESLNGGKGYDRMVVEMLAGDEVSPGDPDVLPATGFLGRNWYKFDRNAWLFETVEQSSVAFLALKLRCARCHDHKYEPISQIDYYRFRAFFEPHAFRIDPVRGPPDPETRDGIARVYDAEPKRATYLLRRGDDRDPDESQPLLPAVPAVFGDVPLDIRPVSLPLEDYYPALRPEVLGGTLRKAESELRSAERDLRKALGKVDGEAPSPEARDEVDLATLKLALARANLSSLRWRAHAAKPMSAAEGRAVGTVGGDRVPEPEEVVRAAAAAEREAAVARAELALFEAERVLKQQGAGAGEADEKGRKARNEAEKKAKAARDALAGAAAAVPAMEFTPLGKVYPASSTGRRSALARWIVDPSNPRTARVAVNHIWRRHFGAALVGSVSNFGLSGQAPTHPELTDWLALELIESGWDMKHLHRLLVTSSTYRMSSSRRDAPASNADRDPDNRLYWRMNPQRMEAEVVRDSLLAVSGELDLSMGGAELDEKLGETSRRRSLYFRVTPDNKMEFLDLFDLANPNECYERRESVVPQQALALSNSALALNQSRRLASRLSAEFGEAPLPENEQRFVSAAFEEILGRRPGEEEIRACARFLRGQGELLKDSAKLNAFAAAAGPGRVPPASAPHLRARENLIHVLFNHNDFVTVR